MADFDYARALEEVRQTAEEVSRPARRTETSNGEVWVVTESAIMIGPISNSLVAAIMNALERMVGKPRESAGDEGLG